MEPTAPNFLRTEPRPDVQRSSIDPRSPEIAVQPNAARGYTSSTKNLTEQNGFAHDDTAVMMLIASPGDRARGNQQRGESVRIAVKQEGAEIA